MYLSISAILAVSLQLSVGVLGAVISSHAPKPMWTEAPSVTKAVLANVEANLSRFVPHMLSEAKLMDLAAVVQGLRPAQAFGMPTAAVADVFGDDAEVTAA
ncbi:hypothetical protein GGI01_000309 [Coemansia sp. RSA 376]|nr:hypothetical protein H4S03_007793 [Coemansia sp. S3946]KAJ2263971.1 hypothetical protein GGI01_000309 [Coemansia sp. RSA 376]